MGQTSLESFINAQQAWQHHQLPKVGSGTLVLNKDRKEIMKTCLNFSRNPSLMRQTKSVKPAENSQIWTRVQNKVGKGSESKLMHVPNLADKLKVQSRTHSQLARTEPRSLA